MFCALGARRPARAGRGSKSKVQGKLLVRWRRTRTSRVAVTRPTDDSPRTGAIRPTAHPTCHATADAQSHQCHPEAPSAYSRMTPSHRVPTSMKGHPSIASDTFNPAPSQPPTHPHPSLRAPNPIPSPSGPLACFHSISFTDRSCARLQHPPMRRLSIVNRPHGTDSDTRC